jgi:hypothetical protein
MAPYWKNSNMLEPVAEDKEYAWQAVPLTSFSADAGAGTSRRSFDRIETSWGSIRNNARSWWVLYRLQRRRHRREIPAHCSRLRGERNAIRKQLLLLVLVLIVLLVVLPLMPFRVYRRNRTATVDGTTIFLEPVTSKTTLSSIALSWIVNYTMRINTIPIGLLALTDETPVLAHDDTSTSHGSLRQRS